MKPSVPVFLLFAIALPMISLAQEPDYSPMTADQRWNDYISTSILSPNVAFRSLA